MFEKIKSVVEEKDLRDILSDPVSRGLLTNLVSKYNIFLSSVNVNQLTRADKIIGDELTFFEKACKWTVSTFSQKFSTCLAINDELTVSQIKELV